MENGIFSKLISWTTKPIESGTVKDWLLGAALISIAAFLWSTVVNTVD